MDLIKEEFGMLFTLKQITTSNIRIVLTLLKK
jgi:hypothetical protein